MDKIKNNKKTIFFGIFILAVLVIFFIINKKNKETPIVLDTFITETSDFDDTITLRGTATPEDTADLSFAQSGRISKIFVTETEQVKTGQRLGEQSLLGLNADYREQQSLIDYYEAQKANLLAGKRPEEIKVIERELEQEEEKLEQNIQSATLLYREVFTTVENAIKNGTDVFFNNPNTDTPKLVFSLPNYPTQTNRAETGRIKIKTILQEIYTKSGSLESDNIENRLKEIETYLGEIRIFLDDSATLVNALQTTNGVSQTNIESWRSIVSSSRIDINSSLSEVQKSKQGIATQKTVIAKKQDELSLAKAGPTIYSIQEIDAQINQAKARRDGIQADINDKTLFSPFSGIVTDIKKNTGEIISAGETALSITSAQKLSLVLDVPENDVSNLSINQKVLIKPDAFEKEYLGFISRINQSETLKEGVTIYEVTVTFDESENIEQLKSGMTADAVIFLRSYKSVMPIPKRFVFEKNGANFIYEYYQESNLIKEKEIKIEKESSDKQFYLINNLEEGMVIGIPK